MFYDVETTGLRRGFDQIVEFAAIRTDSDLQELDRFETRCRLLPHTIPAPEALYLTGANITDLTDKTRLSHYEMVKLIRDKFVSWCPSMFLGFNSIKFDEEFLRQALYQCLYEAYLTNTRGSGRADVLSLCRIAAALRPDVIVPFIDFEGRRIFRLSELAQANGIPTSSAHVAMTDVGTTLALCRRVRDGAPELWSRFLQFSQRSVIDQFIKDEEAFVLFETIGNQPDTRIVTRIGEHNEILAHQYCLDLQSDTELLGNLSHDDLVLRFSQRPRPVILLRTNTAPTLFPLYDATPEQLGGLREEDFISRARNIRQDRRLIEKLCKAAQAAQRTYPASPHVEEQLYGYPFPDSSDSRTMTEFHASDWSQRVALFRSFSDRRYQQLARRLIYFERPDLLPEKERQAMNAEVGRRLLDKVTSDNPWLSIPVALNQIEEMLKTVSNEADRARLSEYATYLANRKSDLEA